MHHVDIISFMVAIMFCGYGGQSPITRVEVDLNNIQKGDCCDFCVEREYKKLITCWL